MQTFPGFDSVYLLDDPLANQPFRGRVEVSLGEATALLRRDWIPDRPIVCSIRWAVFQKILSGLHMQE